MMVTAVALLALAGAACTDATSSVMPASSSDAMAETSAPSRDGDRQDDGDPPRDSLPSPRRWRRRTSASTLAGDGPYTVFAPTDEAFAALPAGTLEELLKPANQAQLSAILAYHVVAGEVMSSVLMSGDVANVNGADVTVKVADGGVTIVDWQGDVAQVVTGRHPGI